MSLIELPKAWGYELIGSGYRLVEESTLIVKDGHIRTAGVVLLREIRQSTNPCVMS
jgi:hypothetical protein